MADTNVTDQQSRGACGSHATHAGRAPRSTGAIQRVSQSLMRAVARLLRRRIRLATRAAAELKSRRPHVIRRRRDRIPRIGREVADPFPSVIKTWHHFLLGLLHMQRVPPFSGSAPALLDGYAVWLLWTPTAWAINLRNPLR